MALFETEMSNLRAVAARQAAPVSTSVLQRDLLVGAMVQTALKLSGIALSHAEEKKLPLLANRVRLRPSAFNTVRAHQRVQLAQLVHATLLPIVADLEDQGVTVPMLTAFQEQIDAAAEVLSAPRDATVNRRAATEQLREAFRRVDAVIANHFDPLLLPLKETHPEFYLRYRAARMLVDRAGGRAGGTEEAPNTPAEPMPGATMLQAA